jgi:hypothetical protein
MPQRIRRVTKETGRFLLTGTNGQRYTIIEQQEVQFITFLDGHTEAVEGMKQYLLPNGHPVNRLENGDFEIVGTGVTVPCPVQASTP